MSERAVFISDVHLLGVDDPRMDPFADFLRSFIGKVDTMVLLGDIFDFYYGFRGVVFWQHVAPLAAMREIAASGVRVVFVEGNHEFRIAEALEQGLGVETLPGRGEITVAGQRIWLAHGDRADPRDYGYRFLYFVLRNPVTATLAGMVPPRLAWWMARLASDGSRAYAGGRGQRLNDLFRKIAIERVQRGYHAALFGHSHQPALEEIQVGERRGWFGNCGDWVRHNTYLTFDGATFELHEHPALVPESSAPKIRLVSSDTK